MNIKKILCPIDFSEFNQLANELASELASETGASIVYLNIPEQEAYDYSLSMYRTEKAALERLTEYRPSKPDVEYSHKVKISNLTAQTIIEFAEANDVDLIVLATHGRTGLPRFIMGSVAAHVVRKSKCPVLTVKPELRKDTIAEPDKPKTIGSQS